MLPLFSIVCSLSFIIEGETNGEPDLKFPCESTSVRNSEPRETATASSSEEADEELLAVRLALSEWKGY